MKAVVFIILAGLSLVFYQNCAPYESGSRLEENSGNGISHGGGSDAVSVTAFELSLHPVLTQHCGSCHGVAQFPLFALLNEIQSHDTILAAQLADLNNPSSSRLVQKIQLGHSGISASVATEIQSGIEDWAVRSGL